MNGTASLARDGGGMVGDAHPTAEPMCFSLAALLGDLQPHAELDLRTLAYHLQQSDATAADGYCHASINEARSALEALVVGIVQVVLKDAGEADSPLRDRAQNGTAFRTYWRCLQEAGFLDADENEMLQFVYSVASVKGSHQGVTDEAWTRLARRIVFAAVQYVTQRYTGWKRNGRSTAPPAGEQPKSTRQSWLPRALGSILHMR